MRDRDNGSTEAKMHSMCECGGCCALVALWPRCLTTLRTTSIELAALEELESWELVIMCCDTSDK